MTTVNSEMNTVIVTDAEIIDMAIGMIASGNVRFSCIAVRRAIFRSSHDVELVKKYENFLISVYPHFDPSKALESLCIKVDMKELRIALLKQFKASLSGLNQ